MYCLKRLATGKGKKARSMYISCLEKMIRNGASGLGE